LSGWCNAGWWLGLWWWCNVGWWLEWCNAGWWLGLWWWCNVGWWLEWCNAGWWLGLWRWCNVGWWLEWCNAGWWLGLWRWCWRTLMILSFISQSGCGVGSGLDRVMKCRMMVDDLWWVMLMTLLRIRVIEFKVLNSINTPNFKKTVNSI